MGVAVGPDNVYVTHPESGQLTVIDSGSGAVADVWSIGGEPFGVALAETSGRVYVTDWAGDRVDVYNPAFDVTPAELITAIITEKGVIEPVNKETILAVLES